MTTHFVFIMLVLAAQPDGTQQVQYLHHARSTTLAECNVLMDLHKGTHTKRGDPVLYRACVQAAGPAAALPRHPPPDRDVKGTIYTTVPPCWAVTHLWSVLCGYVRRGAGLRRGSLWSPSAACRCVRTAGTC